MFSVVAPPRDESAFKLNPIELQLTLMQRGGHTLHGYLQSQAIMRIARDVPTQDDMIMVRVFKWFMQRGATKPHKVYGRTAPIWLCKSRGWYYDFIEVPNE